MVAGRARRHPFISTAVPWSGTTPCAVPVQIGSHGDFMNFLTRPISGTIMVIAFILFALPLIKLVRNWVQTRVSERPL